MLLDYWNKPELMFIRKFLKGQVVKKSMKMFSVYTRNNMGIFDYIHIIHVKELYQMKLNLG